MTEAPVKKPRPADLTLAAGANPRPPGRGWILVDYSWDEQTGVARCVYRRRWDPKQRLVVEVGQPAGDHHPQWRTAPRASREALFQRHAETLTTTRDMMRVGAYGR